MELPAYNTVYRCLQPGRTRMDAELVVDIATALLGDTSLTGQWRQACRVIENRASEAAIVHVTDGLPDDLDAFTGRSGEIARLLNVLGAGSDGATVVISAIEGMAGVGKTRAAVHLAHQLVAAGRFPDVCLSVNLRGYDADLSPADPAAVLEGFLRVLGVTGSQVAIMDLAHRAATFREQLAGRSALILLDNAASADQVRPLLPEHPSCLTLVTSRHRLDVAGATHLPLDVFSPEESLALLRREVGEDRVAADPDSAAAIAESVGHLPLALSLVAGRVKASPEWTLVDQLERLTERRSNLRLDDSVRVAIGLSYDDLGPDHRRLLRLSALHPGRDFDSYAAAALAGSDLEATQALLADLTAANLLQQRVTGRFELHDLVRVFATDRARDEVPARTRHAALTRLFDHYRHVALMAMNLYAPQETNSQPDVSDPGTPRPELPDRASATTWLNTERPNLIAMAIYADAHGWPDHTGHLSLILFRYLDDSAHFHDAETLHTLASRTATGHVKGLALSNLGATTFTLGRHQEARDLLTQTMAVFRECGDYFNERNALRHVGVVELFLGRFVESHRLFQLAADNARATDDLVALGRALLNVGITHYLLGRYPEALETHWKTLAIVRESGDRVVEAGALINIGSANERLGDYREAVDHLRQGLDLTREIGHRMAEADALNQLGVVYAGLASYQQALDHHEQALSLALDTGMREIEVQVRNGMGPALRGLGRADQAADQHREALSMACDLQNRYQQACAHDGIGSSVAVAGDVDSAHTHWQKALVLHTDLGTPEAADVAARLRECPPTNTRPPIAG